MADYFGLSPVQWARSLVTTMAEYLPTVEEEMMRNYKFMALLKQNGRISYNHYGRGCTWQVQYRLHPTEGNTGETVRSWVRQNLWKKAVLDWRGFQATDAITERERRENQGRAAIIDLMKGFKDRVKTSLEQTMNLAWLADGNATGNEKVWHGIESMFGTNGTVNYTSGAQRSANAADYVAYPSDTYASLSTILGNYGGDNGTVGYWPSGNADPEYDFFSPLIVNTLSSSFGGTSHTFADQGNQVMRYAITQSYRNPMGGKQMDKFFLSRDLFMDFKNQYDSKQQIWVDSTTGLRALGFKDVIMFDGVEVTFENSIAPTVGYGLNINNVELMNLYGETIVADQDDFFYDPNTQEVKCAVKNLGNLKFQSPRNFVKMMPYTAM